jgi:hypothetical protein
MWKHIPEFIYFNYKFDNCEFLCNVKAFLKYMNILLRNEFAF